MKRANYNFYFLIFSTLTVVLILIGFLYKAFPLFTSNALFFCQELMSGVMFEVPRSLSIALILSMGVILGIGFLSFLLQLGRTHLLLRGLLINRVDISRNLLRPIAALGLTNKVILVKNDKLFSFCCGIFSPYIIVTTALVKSLTEKELEAVLLHEQSHLINRDPMKILLGKTISSMFFFLPIFRELYKKLEAVNELSADQWTINYQKKTTFLRCALKKILSTPQLNLATVSSVSGSDYFEIRIHRLVNPSIRYKTALSFLSLATSIIFVFISLFLLLAPVNAHMESSHSSSSLFLCSADQSCSRQCHAAFKDSKPYVPSQFFLTEKKCGDDSVLSKDKHNSYSSVGN